MKLKIKIFTSILNLMLMLTFVGCGDNKNSDYEFLGKTSNEDTSYTEQLSYYSYDNYVPKIIDDYNKACINAGRSEYKINVIQFENAQKMQTKMSTEIMSGGGPDLFTLNQDIPFEKLIRGGIFADVNEIVDSDTAEDKIDFNDYNKIVMDSGVYNGKRYFVPVSYMVDIVMLSKYTLKNYKIDIKQGESLTFKNLDKDFEKFFKNRKKNSYFLDYCDQEYYYSDDLTPLFKRLINSYIDRDNKKIYFNSDEFRNILKTFKKIKASSGAKHDELGNVNITLIEENSFFASSFRNMCNAVNPDYYVLAKGFTKEKDDYNAYVESGFAFNRNCHKTEKMLDFMKYVLNQERQERMVGAKGSSYGDYCHPVHNKAFEKAIETCGRQDYYWNDAYSADSDLMKSYINICQKVNHCELTKVNDYFVNTVAGELIANYLDGKLSDSKFIRNLNSAAEIYLYE